MENTSVNMDGLRAESVEKREHKEAAAQAGDCSGTAAEDRCREIERSIIKKFRKEIWRPFVKALNEYDMIQEGDNIAVCISGGKDSMLLAKCMQEILRHGKMEFGLHFLVMDPGYNPENRRMIEENARIMGIPITVFESDIFNVVVDVDQSPCYLCARMRRGYLYANAKKLGCNKIALGHHFDDVIPKKDAQAKQQEYDRKLSAAQQTSEQLVCAVCAVQPAVRLHRRQQLGQCAG